MGLVLLGALVPKALEWGMQEVEFSWVAESNVHSRRALEERGRSGSRPTAFTTWTRERPKENPRSGAGS